MIMRIFHPSKASVVRCAIIIFVFLLSSCVTSTYVSYPQKNEVIRGEKLPIDGVWVNHNNARFRISQGILYIDDPGINPPFRNGQVIGKNIKQVSSKRYTLDSGSHNISLGIVGFGKGEIEVISSSSIVLRTFPNKGTRLLTTIESIFRYSELDSPNAFMASFNKDNNHDIKSQLPVNTPSYLTLSPSTKWAVIIGISRYQYSGQSGLSNLIFADDDAKVFAASLRNLGWPDSHIKLLLNENATQRNLMIALKSWLTKAGPNDQIVLFWSGHGYPDPEDPEKVYFATYDTDISIPATGYRMDEVRNALEEIGSKNVILLADTCHAGKLITRGERGISIVPQLNRMEKEEKIPKGWVFMVGADTDRQAIEDSSWSNGAFTHSLIKGINGAADGFQSVGPKDGIVTMGELRAYMNSAMPEDTQKVLGVAKRPVITTSTGDPDIWNLTLQVSR